VATDLTCRPATAAVFASRTVRAGRSAHLTDRSSGAVRAPCEHQRISTCILKPLDVRPCPSRALLARRQVIRWSELLIGVEQTELQACVSERSIILPRGDLRHRPTSTEISRRTRHACCAACIRVLPRCTVVAGSLSRYRKRSWDTLQATTGQLPGADPSGVCRIYLRFHRTRGSHRQTRWTAAGGGCQEFSGAILSSLACGAHCGAVRRVLAGRAIDAGLGRSWCILASWTDLLVRPADTLISRITATADPVLRERVPRPSGGGRLCVHAGAALLAQGWASDVLVLVHGCVVVTHVSRCVDGRVSAKRILANPAGDFVGVTSTPVSAGACLARETPCR
jgi:hypothetical protein